MTIINKLRNLLESEKFKEYDFVINEKIAIKDFLNVAEVELKKRGLL